MNDVLPPPLPSPPSVDPGIRVPEPTPKGSWVAAVAAAVALEFVAVVVATIGFFVWFALLWGGTVTDGLWFPLLLACGAPSVAIWIGSGWLAARLAGDRRGWSLMLLAPVVGAAFFAVAGLV